MIVSSKALLTAILSLMVVWGGNTCFAASNDEAPETASSPAEQTDISKPVFKDKPTQKFVEAVKHFQSGKGLKEAFKLSEEVVKATKGNPQQINLYLGARHLKAQIYLMVGDIGSSEKLLTELLEQTDAEEVQQTGLKGLVEDTYGDWHLAQGLFKPAANHYEQALKYLYASLNNPQRANLHRKICFSLVGELKGLSPDYQSELEAADNKTDKTLILPAALYEDTDKALYTDQCAASYLRLSENPPIPYFRHQVLGDLNAELGERYYAAGDNETAEPFLRASIEHYKAIQFTPPIDDEAFQDNKLDLSKDEAGDKEKEVLKQAVLPSVQTIAAMYQLADVYDATQRQEQGVKLRSYAKAYEAKLKELRVIQEAAEISASTTVEEPADFEEK